MRFRDNLASVMKPSDFPQEKPTGAVDKCVQQRRGGRIEDSHDLVAAEVPVALAYNDTPFAVMMATPDGLDDFALGFSLSESIVATAAELDIVAIETSLEGVSIAMAIPESRAATLQQRQRSLQGRSGCGLCGTASIEAVLRLPARVGDGVVVEAVAIERALRELHASQPLNSVTGAVHAAAWADADGCVALVREDVGRHNALDKLIGAMSRAGIDPASGFAVITSRASYEMVMKAAQAGIPVVVAISAPTALAIALADSANLTLVGFARDNGHVVYTHPWRLPAAAPLEPTA